MEYGPRNVGESGKDVPRAGGVFPSLQSAAEAASRVQKVNVVGAHKALGHSDNRLVQALLAVVVRGCKRNQTGQLGHLHFVSDILLDAAIEDLPLGRFQAINHAGNRPRAIRDGEVDQFLVDEIRIYQLVDVLVQICPWLRIVFNREGSSC